MDDLWRAGGVVSAVEGQGTRLDDHEARARVRVPAKGSARRDSVLQDPDIRFTLGVDPGLPLTRERLRIDLVELSDGEDRAGDAINGRRQHGPAVRGHTRYHHEKREYGSNVHLGPPGCRFGPPVRSMPRAPGESPKNELAVWVGQAL